MKYYYCMLLLDTDCIALGDITRLAAQQACVSTRQRTDRWELKVHADHVYIRFLHKADMRDFSEAFEEALDDVLAHHGLVLFDNYEATSPSRVEMYLMAASSLLAM